MIGAGLILFAVIGFIAALIKKKNPEMIKDIKPEDTGKVMALSVGFFVLGIWLRM